MVFVWEKVTPNYSSLGNCFSEKNYSEYSLLREKSLRINFPVKNVTPKKCFLGRNYSEWFFFLNKKLLRIGFFLRKSYSEWLLFEKKLLRMTLPWEIFSPKMFSLVKNHSEKISSKYTPHNKNVASNEKWLLRINFS